MRILHITNGPLSGGAARGALWLHEGLCDLGIDSTLITSNELTNVDTNIHSINALQSKIVRLGGKLEKLLLLMYPRRNRKNQFSLGLFGLNLHRLCQLWEPDLVNIHWVNGGLLKCSSFISVDKPVVWTMRDMWPMTGGCHYSYGCELFSEGCGKCPYLGSRKTFDLSFQRFQARVNSLPRNLHVATISDWLAGEAKKSRMFAGHQIESLGNAVDDSVFYCESSIEAKKKLGIADVDKAIVLVGAQDLNDEYKGIPLFIESLNHLDLSRYLILFFGGASSQICASLEGVECRELGFVKDDSLLRAAYSASDVLVCPSLFEAFGKTIIEASMCGTPSVVFDSSGPAELVDHKKSGYIAKAQSPEELALGIDWCARQSKGYFTDKCIEVGMKYSKVNIAKNYVTYYKRILEGKYAQN